MKVSVLASGSKGNCTLVQGANTSFIIDMGISMRRLKNELSNYSLNLEDLSGIFITHEHSDHIKGLTTMTKYHNIPLLTREKTFKRIANILNLTNPNFVAIKDKEKTRLGDMEIENFSISHDAADPCAYHINDRGKRVTVATDLGIINEDLQNYLNISQGAVLEANYDMDMLCFGNYPLRLKRRIAGIYGHLSNGDTAQVLGDLQLVPEQIILAHLSEENNMPQIAVETVSKHLQAKGINLNNHLLKVAQEKVAVSFEVEG